MTKFVGPIIAVIVGLIVSIALQSVDVKVAVAKGLGVIAVIATLAVWWQRKARA